MATISSLGIGSGVDSNNIVSSLVALEKAPLTTLQNAAKVDTAQITAFAKMQSEFSALADAANALRPATAWQGVTASSTNTSVATVAATTGAATGSFSLDVDRLAQAQSTASGSITTGSQVGAGTLTIQLGTWKPADASTVPPTPTSFEDKSGATALTLKIGAGDNVASIAAKINKANAGVTATSFNDGSGDRLLLTSQTTGAVNGFKITAADTLGNDLTDGTGLSQLAFDPGAPVPYGMAQSGNPVTYGADASARINGLTVTAPTNTLDKNIPGVTITLLATTSTTPSGGTPSSAPITVAVSQDVQGIVKNIEAFATAYNTLAQDITSNTSYDSSTQTAALFQGDGSILGLQSMLRSMVGSTSEGSVAYTRLSDVGIQVQVDGTLSIDTTKLSAAANNGSEMQKLFTTNNKNIATNGFALKFGDFAAGAVAAGGLVNSKSAALQKVMSTNTADQQKINEKATALQNRLQAQYSALDTKMTKLTALSSYVSQQVTTWNKSNSNN